MPTKRPKIRDLPRGVELVVSDDADGRPLYSLRPDRPQERTMASHDQAVITDWAWMTYRDHRPLTIDDAHLQQIVQSPPLSPARLLGELLALQCGRWIISSTIELINRATDIKFQEGDPVTKHAVSTLETYQARSWMSVCVLEGAFSAEEPRAALVEHFGRWKHMLHDYLRESDDELYACIAALTIELDLSPSSADVAATDLVHRHRMDAALGVLLANAAAHELRSVPQRALHESQPTPAGFSEILAGFEDPFSTQSYGTLGFWCKAIWVQLTSAPIEARIAPSTAASIVETAYNWVQSWDNSLLSALERVHPLIARPLAE